MTEETQTTLGAAFAPDSLHVMAENVATLPDGKICDFVDEKIRTDTPEEYVRQNIERRLVLELGYERSQIAVEFPIKIGSQRKRVDLAIFPPGAPHSQDTAVTFIECKRDSVEPSSKKDGVDQLKSYMAASPNVQWGLWTNGNYKAVFRVVREHGKVGWEEPNDIPSAQGDVEQIDRPSRETLRHAVDDNLLFSFKTCHNHIYVTDGMQKQPAFFELLKLIFCKIHDERNLPQPLQFYATAKEKLSNDGRLTVVRRIGKIFDAVKQRYPTIFDAGDAIRLQPRSLAYVVAELQGYSFLNTGIDVKGKAYEEVVGANLRGDRGEFFTPRNVQRMVIRMLDLTEEERFLDPACGTGGFLVIALKTVLDLIHLSAEASRSPEALERVVDERARQLANECFFGIDINPDLVKATKMNMVMNNDGSGNIFRQDSLLHPHQWSSDFRQELARSLRIEPSRLKGPADLALFDVIATNPPFGSKLPIRDRETLSQYELGHVWAESGGRWDPTDQVQGSAPPEILFIERCWQFLRPGGRLGIVLPDAILGAPGRRYVREWIVRRCRLVASIDLHPDTFQPRNGTRTSVLILQRKTEDEMRREAEQGQLTDYEVFMAEVRAIGHDKRGNTIYQRSKDGEILLAWPDPGDGSSPQGRVKIEDDDTPHVAEEFLRWKAKAVLGW